MIQLSPELPNEQLHLITETVGILACECPSYLVQLLQKVREFRRYTHNCIEMFPEQQATHQWLNEQAIHMESLLSATILDLLRQEDLLDEHNQLCLEQLSDRALKTALRQQEFQERHPGNEYV